MSDSDEQEICFCSAIELSSRARGGDISATEILKIFLNRIQRINPTLNAIVSIDEEQAYETARQLDAIPAASRRLLHGVPMAVKDLAAARGFRMTMGSPIYKNYYPDTDELFVSRLRKVGVVILGKTNTPEFGAGSQTFNEVFGPTVNPYDTEKTCGGSSGGAAVALAARLLPLADGSDLGGSLRNPASFCNVVGFRPSPGRIPSWPKKSIDDQLTVYGPMARSVEDSAYLLAHMAGPDERVTRSLPEAGSNFLRPLARSFGGARVALSVDLGMYEVDSRVADIVKKSADVFASLGVLVEECSPDLRGADEIFQTLRARTFSVLMKEDYIKHPESMKESLIWNIEKGLHLTQSEIVEAETQRRALMARVSGFFQRYDFLVCPSAQVPPFDVTEEWVQSINGKKMQTYLDWMGICYAVTVTGLPAISIPAGFTDDGLPVGIQIVGSRGDDWGVLQLAHAFERETGLAKRIPLLSR